MGLLGLASSIGNSRQSTLISEAVLAEGEPKRTFTVAPSEMDISPPPRELVGYDLKRPKMLSQLMVHPFSFESRSSRICVRATGVQS